MRLWLGDFPLRSGPTPREATGGLKPAAIGAGVRVKINANIGTSPHDISLEKEQAKLAAALEYGADAIMDLSTGGNLDEIRTGPAGPMPGALRHRAHLPGDDRGQQPG
jgi:hypothetical protein